MIAAMIERLIRSVGRDPRTVPDIHIAMTPLHRLRPGFYRAATLVAPRPQGTRARGDARCRSSTATRAHEDLLAEGLAAVVPQTDEPVPEAARREEPTAAARWREADTAALRAPAIGARDVAVACAGRTGAGGGRPLARLDALAAVLPDALRAPTGVPGRRRVGPGRARGGARRRADGAGLVRRAGTGRGGRPAWTARTCAALRAFFPGAEIVLSTWAGTYPKEIPYDALVLSEDPGPVGTNPSNANVNRQLVSTLAEIDVSRPPVAKVMRSYRLQRPRRLLREWRPPARRGEGAATCSTSGYSSQHLRAAPTYLAPLAFHPTDWSCMGTREDLLRLFGAPLMTAEQARGDRRRPRSAASSTPSPRTRRGARAVPLAQRLRRVDPSIGRDHVGTSRPRHSRRGSAPSRPTS